MRERPAVEVSLLACRFTARMTAAAPSEDLAKLKLEENGASAPKEDKVTEDGGDEPDEDDEADEGAEGATTGTGAPSLF